MSFSNGLEKRPKLRFPGYIENWAHHKFGDFGTVAMCKRIYKEQTASEGDIPFYKIGTFGGKPDAFISRELYIEYRDKYPYPKVGDLLISASGTIGRVIEYNGEEAYFQDSNIVWLKHDERIINSFLKYIYSVVKWRGIEGSTIKRLYNDNFLSTELYIPSISEQHKISDFLSVLDNHISKQKALIESLKKYKRGVMRAIFRDKALLFSNAAKWESVRLDNECTFFSGGTPKSTDSRFYGGTIPFIRSGEIHGEKTELFLTDDGLKYSSAKTVSKGDLILALYGATSGEVDIAKIDGAINQAILCIRPSRINRTFLKYLLEDSQDDILNTYLQGGQGNLSAEIIKNLVFEIPDEQFQSKVVIFLSAIDQRIISSCVYVEKLTEFRSGLLQKLFI